jgi:hypothetical protein
LRHEFQDDTWSQEFFTYDPRPTEFTSSWGLRTFFVKIPTILFYFFPHIIEEDCDKNKLVPVYHSSFRCTRKLYGGAQMDELNNYKAQGNFCNLHVYGDETATLYEVILGEGRLFLSLFHHL